MEALLRHGNRPAGASPADFPAVDVLLATPLYFSFTGRQTPEVPEGQPATIFYVSEEVHIGELPSIPPQPFLKVGRVHHGPAEVRALTDSPHHRTTMVRYKASWSDGSPILTPENRSIEMVFPSDSGAELPGSVLSWKLPISYGADYSNGDIVVGADGQAASPDIHDDRPGEARAVLRNLSYLRASPVTLMAVAALLGVLLVALTPCLIDLALYYGACLGATGAVIGAAGIKLARSHLVKGALFFTLGFGLVYATGGVAAGYVGQLLQRFGFAIDLDRPVKIVVGLVIIFLALRVAAQARVPMVCRLPVPKLSSMGSSAGPWSTTLQGATFAARCFTCFSGAALSVLLFYAATSGSPLTGALLLISLTLGLGVVLVAAALSATSFLPLVSGLKRIRPSLGLTSALVMAGFGVTAILDIETEHIFSDFVLRLFGVG